MALVSPALTSCVHVQDASFKEVDEQAQRYYGYAVIGHEVRSFQSCEQARDLWLQDESGQLATLYAELVPIQPAYQPLFVVFEGTTGSVTPEAGFAKDYQGAVRAVRILYAGFEGPGCAWDWDSFAYRATGNEPFWSLIIDAGQGAVFKHLGHDPISWSRMKAKVTPGGIHYRFEDGTAPDASFTIDTEACRDSMSGAYTSLSGVLTLGKDRYRGCVIEGATAVVDERP